MVLRPRAKMFPNKCRFRNSQALQSSLSDESDLDVAVVGSELAPDGNSLSFSFSVKILVS